MDLPFICISLHSFSTPGVAFFVFSEKINVYDENNPEFKEISEASRAFTGSVTSIATTLPLYKIFPTKPYRDYLNNVHRLQNIGRKMIKRKYIELKAAMETGKVDESRATGKHMIHMWA